MDKEKRAYTFSDAQRLTGVQRGHLARWAERGLITADLGGGGVSGSHRKFTFRNIFDIAIAVELQRLRVHQDFIKWVLTSLQLLDPDTVRNADVPANRAARYFDSLPPPERKRRLKALIASNKRHVASEEKKGRPRDMILVANPYTAIHGLEERLASDKDNDAKRWMRFKDPDTRGPAAFVVLVLPEASFDVGNTGPKTSFVYFVETLRGLEEHAAVAVEDPEDPHRRDILSGVTSIVIDARRVLVRLERETGDRL